MVKKTEQKNSAGGSLKLGVALQAGEKEFAYTAASILSWILAVAIFEIMMWERVDLGALGESECFMGTWALKLWV